MPRAIVAKIERTLDVNPALFDLLSIVESDAEDLDNAMTILQSRIGAEHSLYWFYRGGSHIAVQSHNHQKRIAILTKAPAKLQDWQLNGGAGPEMHDAQPQCY